MTSEIAAQYATLATDYAAAYVAATNPDTRTKGKIAAKNTAKDALKLATSNAAKIIDGTPSVSDEQRLDLGLSVRKPPSPRPAPDTAPVIDVLATNGRTLTIRLRDVDGGKRARPAGIEGAAIWTHVGQTPPADPTAWTFKMNTAKTTVDLTFDASVPNGASVWVCAFWIGSRMRSSPASAPVSANLPGGSFMSKAA